MAHRPAGPDWLPFLQILLFVSICSGMLYGYNAGAYSAVMLQLTHATGMTEARLGTLVASFDFGEILGTCFAPLADRLGRKRILLVCAGLLSLGPLAVLIDTSYGVLLAERALMGFASSITFILAFVMIAEIAEARRKALLLSCVMVGVSAGAVMALSLGGLFANAPHWNWIIVVAALPAMVQFAGLLPMPESPIYLRGHGATTAADASARWYRIDPVPADRADQVSNLGLQAFLAALRQRRVRRGLLLGALIILAGTLSGSILVGYGPLVLEHFAVGDVAQILRLLAGFALLGFGIGLVALIPVSRGFSYPMLVGALVVMGLSLAGLSLSTGPTMALLFYASLYVAFSFGIRPTIFQMLPHMLDDRSRATGMALFNLLFMGLVALNDLLFPRAMAASVTATFQIYAVCALLLAAACFYFLRGWRTAVA